MRHCTLIFFILLLACQKPATDFNSKSIKPCSENPRFWQYKNLPVLLLGASDEDNLFQLPHLESHLDLLASAGGNYIRNTMSARDSNNAQPFLQLDNGLYDLQQWNAEYWQRFNTLLELCFERDIIVQIEIWAFHDFNENPDLPTWAVNPWNPQNNITFDESVLKTRYGNLRDVEHAFFASVPNLQNNEPLLSVQKRFVDKILDISLSFPNVLYCITNEIHPHYSPEWGWYWARYVKERASAQNKTIYVTEMLWQIDFEKPQQQVSLAHPEIYDYFEASQNSFQKGDAHWHKLQFAYHQIAPHPRPINCVKIYGSDHGPNWTGLDSDAVERFWRQIIGGAASSRFHRPPAGLGLSPKAQIQLKSMLLLAHEYNFIHSTPDSTHRLLKNRNDNSAFAAAIKNEKWIVYFPTSGAVDFSPANRGHFNVKWLDINHVRWYDSSQYVNVNSIHLKTPGDGMWVALVSRK